MEDILAAYTAAATLGATHALEIDHMVAVNAFLGNRPRVSVAVGYGMRWALGHAGVVLVAGAVLAATGIAVPPSLEGWFELLVGAVLVGLGIWAGATSRRLHLHTPAEHGGHAHLHAHPSEQHPHSHAHKDPTRHHRHFSSLVGAFHGLAGTATVVALIPVTLMTGLWPALGYLAAFGAGTVVTMSAYAGVAAFAVGRSKTAGAAQRIAVFTAAASVVVGVWWIVRAGVDLVG